MSEHRFYSWFTPWSRDYYVLQAHVHVLGLVNSYILTICMLLISILCINYIFSLKNIGISLWIDSLKYTVPNTSTYRPYIMLYTDMGTPFPGKVAVHPR